MKDPVRVLVVDDHFVVRKGICALLTDTAEIVVAGEAADGNEAVAEAKRLQPQVILMDLKLPGLDGVEATRAILAEQPEVGIVILTSTDVEDEVLAAVQAGAQGYLAKTTPWEELVQAIRQVAQGEAWLPPRLTRRLLGRMNPPPAVESPRPLTERERDVLLLLARGWNNRRIAENLHVAEITIRTHVSHILDKLGVTNRVEAALHALRSGLVSLQDV
ncbi:MAG TPA: response regulator transcription factor [Thermoanaerobaculia bacterium]|nr:response regulator transcription factor [Thermoanaerobaculia bacterium]